MDLRPALITDGQATETVKPGQRALDDPTMPTQPLAALDSSAGNPALDAAPPQILPTAGVVVPFIGVQLRRPLSGSPAPPADRGNRLDQRLEERAIVDVRRRELDRERDALAVDHKMALRARFAAIRRIRPGFAAPFFAGTLLVSSAARVQSILSASPSRWSSSWWSRSQTPACCQSRSRRQQVTPLPQPSSWGSNSQGMPLRSTKRMPVRAARSGTRGRPPFGLGGSSGRSGAITFHSSSETSRLAMPKVYNNLARPCWF